MPRLRGRKTTASKSQLTCTICGGPVSGPVTHKDEATSYRRIPGFFYDTEKKKYFKMKKGNKANTHPQQLKKEQNICEKCTQTKLHKVKKKQTSLVKFILSRQQNPSRQSEIREVLAKHYHMQQSMKLNLTHVDTDGFAVCHLQPDLRQTRLLTLYKASGSGLPVVQFHQITRESNKKLSITPGSGMMKNQPVTSLNWSPHCKTSNFFLISLLGEGDKWGEGLLFQVDGLTQTFVSRYTMNHHSVWTSAWNKNPFHDNIIALGASKLALTFDVNTRRRMLRFVSCSDVFAQYFAVKSPLLFNGFRNGDVRGADIRLSGSRLPCISVSQNKPITCVKLLQDELYLLTGGMDDTIRRWDLRMPRQVVQEYRGHCNQLTHGLQFFVDPTDSLLFAAGEDSITRVWSMRSGEIVRTIPFPVDENTHIHSIPAISYADEWGGPGGLPGLLYGTNDNVRWYGT